MEKYATFTPPLSDVPTKTTVTEQRHVRLFGLDPITFDGSTICSFSATIVRERTFLTHDSILQCLLIVNRYYYGIAVTPSKLRDSLVPHSLSWNDLGRADDRRACTGYLCFSTCYIRCAAGSSVVLVTRSEFVIQNPEGNTDDRI